VWVSTDRLRCFLRRLREALKTHSVARLARTCGLSANYLRLIRTRFYVPPIKTITRIEQAIDTLRREEVAWRTLIEMGARATRQAGVVEFARRMDIPASNIVRILSGEWQQSSLAVTARVRHRLA
jgi:hypothetical protein